MLQSVAAALKIVAAHEAPHLAMKARRNLILIDGFPPRTIETTLLHSAVA